jgi:ParB family chromosome partitioning protein
LSKKRLGRGLDALLSSDVAFDPIPGGQSTVATREVVRGRYQPRQNFDEERLNEMAQSIKQQGVIQPILVRPRPQGGYELIAGERRWRAAQIAGLEAIPAVIREVTDEQASALALIENVQREDLNPLEEAGAMQRLKEEFGLTQQQVADAVGKSRVAVTNLLRLLNLQPKVRAQLADGELEMGHARALLPLDPTAQIRAADVVVSKQLSVRQTETLVRTLLQGQSQRRKQPKTKDADLAALERDVTERVGAPVSIDHNAAGKGKVVISYTNLDELDGILKHIG